MAERENWREPYYTETRGRYQETRRVHESGIRHESTRELIQDFLAEAQYLAKAEIHLAKAELRDDIKAAGSGAGMIGAGAALLFAGMLCLVGFLVALLSLAMKVWVAALLVGLAVVGIGALVALSGRSKLKEARPEDFPRSLKENREWASRTMRDVRSNRRVHA